MKFDPYNPPRFWGQEPQKFNTQYDTISTSTETYSDIAIPEGATHIEVEGSDDGWGVKVNIYFKKARQVRNTSYKAQLSRYLKNAEKFKQDLFEWEKQKVIWDAEQIEKDKNKRKEQFLQLKKEFEND